jgi:tRNA-5-methyluridine54 2-sulfurtransferase
LEKARGFSARMPGSKLHVVDILDSYGKTIPQIAREKTRGRGKPCSACGLTKRYVMNRLAAEGGYSVLATGHNLDDEAAVLMQNTLHWQVGYLARQAPVLPASREGFAKKVKPFCRFYERETATFALVRGIDYIYDECPHAVGNLTNFYKTLLNQLEAESPGAKLQFYIQFLTARKQGLFKDFDESIDLHACEVCGQPTTAPGRCAFCRMWDIRSNQDFISPDEIRVPAEDENDNVELRVADAVDISGF